MNIGIVTTWYSCGAGFVSKNYKEIFSKQNNVFIYARGDSNRTIDPAWESPYVTRSPYHPSITGIYKQHFKKWIIRNNIELIFFNEQRYWDTVIFSQKNGIMTGAYIDYYTANTIPFFKLYDFLICNTIRHYEVFRNHPQCIYLPWGINNINFQKTKKNNKKINFLISAGWTGVHAKSADWLDRRGCGLLLKIFSKVRGDCNLLVYSQVGLDSCPLEWKDAINQDSRISFIEGTFSPFPYKDGDVYIYPSRLDGIGLTLPEAISFGLPAITTNSPPMNEFVHHMFNGLLVDVEMYTCRPDGYFWPESIITEQSLINSIEYYINNPDQVLVHSENALKFAIEKLDWSKNSQNLNQYIKNLKKIVNKDDNDFKVLSKRAHKHDYFYNPSPNQKIIAGMKEIIITMAKIFNIK